MQSFLGKINFVKRFIPDFSQIVLPLQNMIKKNSVFKWLHKENVEIICSKHAYVQDPPNLTLFNFMQDTEYIPLVNLFQKI